MSSNEIPSRRCLTITEAAEYLNVSVRFMRRRVAQREIPYLKLGGLVRFELDDLDEFIAQSRVPAADHLVGSAR